MKKTIVRNVISALFLMGLVTAYGSMPANAQTGHPSASGTYKFVSEDGFSKSVEFSATSDERGATTGQMTFKDEAGVSDQDPDGVVDGKAEPPAPFFMTAKLDSLTVDRNRAVIAGTISDSSVPSYIGRWVQVVVEDNGDGGKEPDKLSWCFCKPEVGGWVPADAERPDDGAYWKWWATDAEREDDKGVQSTNIIPGNTTSCKVFPLSAYPFDDVRNGEGQIQVQP